MSEIVEMLDGIDEVTHWMPARFPTVNAAERK